ncbi:MAG: hypothetical protein VKJ09_05600, partial [Leptolyngbya sp.]|nr:hypothetical protein [Leptolyngbya sp.]
QQWVGLAKHLARTGAPCTVTALADRLRLSPRTLAVGLDCLRMLGFATTAVEAARADDTTPPRQDQPFQIQPRPDQPLPPQRYTAAVERFTQAVQEEQFRRRYFHQVPAQVLTGVLNHSPSP